MKNLFKRFKKYVLENLDLIVPGVIVLNGGYYIPANFKNTDDQK